MARRVCYVCVCLRLRGCRPVGALLAPLRRVIHNMYVKCVFTVEVGFCEVTLLSTPVGRARVDAQRARSTTTHGRSRRGSAGGTSEASAGGTN